MNIDINFCFRLQCRRLIGASKRYKFAIVYPTGHVWFEVRLNGGGRGGGGPREMDEKTPARRGCWKAKHHLISCASMHFQKWASNQSKRVKLKTWSTVFRQKQTHEGPMSGTVRHFIFGRKKKWLRQNLLRGHKYELIFAALFIFRTKILEYSCR